MAGYTNYGVYEMEVPEFHWRERHRDFYRGSVSELTPVVRYASRGEKIAQALFRGVPYQIGAGTTVLRIRLEEHVVDAARFPERTVTVEYQSDAEGELTYGDDITVETVRKHNKIVANKIWVNENNRQRRVGAGLEIPAWTIRMMVVFMLMLFVGTVSAVVSFVRSPAFTEFAVTCIIVLGLLFCVMSTFRRRRW